MGVRLFRPTFDERRDGSPRDDEERDLVAAVVTYRYLRLGLVMVAVALIVALVLQEAEAGCWQRSISAYYYFDAGPIFVSGMFAIGFGLIVIKGNTTVEDFFLNAAGALAPIVALVPTTEEPKCVRGEVPGKGKGGGLPADIVAEVMNNMGALLSAATLAVVLGLIVLVVDCFRRNTDVTAGKVRSRIVMLGLSAAAVGIGWLLLTTGKLLDLHGWSAVFMFGFLAVASALSGLRLLLRPVPRKIYGSSYLLIGIAMGLGGVIIKWGIDEPWPHRILVLELVEIALFGAMWVVQSIERWGKVTAAEAPNIPSAV